MRQAIIPPKLAEAAQAAGMSPAIRAGDLMFLTGATGGNPDGTMPKGAADQARVALGKVSDVLAHAHASEANVVEMTSYHMRIQETFAEVEEVLHSFFTAPLPAWTAEGVAELRRPNALVEFRIVAHLPETKDHP